MKKINLRLLIAALILLAAVFALVTTQVAKKTYEKKVAEEQLTETDFYSMQQFCGDNAKAVKDALRSGDAKKLGELMPGAAGIEDVMAFADWKKADFKNAVSLGAGSLTAAPDKNGKIDISERFIVEAGDSKYVLFIETLTSRWGRINEGITAVGVTTSNNFDATDHEWLGEPGDQSVLAGELWWSKQE